MNVERYIEALGAGEYRLELERVQKFAVNRATDQCALKPALRHGDVYKRQLNVSASKRSSRLGGSRSMTTGGMKRSRTERQNAVNGKSDCHHVRHRCKVRTCLLYTSRCV